MVGSFSAGDVYLPTVPNRTSAFFAIEAIGYGPDGGAGVLAFANNTGGNPLATPPETPAFLTGWDNLDVNLVLYPGPEPGTMTLVGLSGLCLLLFRRRK